VSLATVAAIVFGSAAPARAADPTTPPPAQTDDATERGRRAYTRGVQLTHDQQWGDALAAFEEAAAARDSPIVQFNIAFCLRALGRYVAADRAIDRALAKGDGLDPAKLEDAKAYKAEFAQLLVRVKITLEPVAAKLTVDGRPLVVDDRAPATLLAGVAPPGEPASPGLASFTLVLDPGVHLVRATREGHHDAVIQRAYRAAEQATLALRLDVLPATIAVRSEPGDAIVRVNKREVGLAPVEFQRLAGKYQLEVTRDTYEPYTATLDLTAGQRADITAKLVPYHEPLTKKWWFWTGAAVVVLGGAALTYALTRPTPQPPPYDMGSANWLVKPSGFRW
jgi:hypothetical protein